MTHNSKMIVGLVIAFVVGGLQALHVMGGAGAYIDMIVPILLGAEHMINGNTE